MVYLVLHTPLQYHSELMLIMFVSKMLLLCKGLKANYCHPAEISHFEYLKVLVRFIFSCKAL